MTSLWSSPWCSTLQGPPSCLQVMVFIGGRLRCPVVGASRILIDQPKPLPGALGVRGEVGVVRLRAPRVGQPTLTEPPRPSDDDDARRGCRPAAAEPPPPRRCASSCGPPA